MNVDVKIPTTRNGKATFNIIVESAIELFYKSGYHNTSVGNITKKAGVGAGTFYLYFPNKFVLYKYILNEFQHKIRKEIAESISKFDSRYEKEREGIKTFITFAVKNPETYNIIWESLYIDRDIFKEYYSSFADRYVIGLNKSMKDGEIREVDTEIISYILIGITNFIGLKVILDLGTNNDDIDMIVDKVMDFLSNGLFK